MTDQASPATWTTFVRDHGVAAAVAALAAICGMCCTQLDGAGTAAAIDLQSALILIALGCVAVLSYRNHSDVIPAVVPHR